jgi:hypothetical protein
MASIVKIKRSSVQGKAPTVPDLQAGELALNTRDGKLFSSDGSTVFEVGANTTSINVGTLTVGNTTPFTFPTTDGTDGQILKTDGSGNLTWQDDTSGSVISANTSSGSATVVDSFPKATYRSGKYTVQVSNIDGHQVSELLVMHSNNTVHFVQYGDIVVSSKASLGNFGTQINNANVEITFTPTTTSFHSTVSVQRNLIPVNDANVIEGSTDLESDSLGTLDLGTVSGTSVASQDLGSV